MDSTSRGFSRVAASLALFATVASPASVLAWEHSVTPYGAYCRECTDYGVCKEPIPPHHAIRALSSYFQERGLSVGTIHHKGRFIEADIYRDHIKVDKILFDRKTGRIRSIY